MRSTSLFSLVALPLLAITSACSSESAPSSSGGTAPPSPEEPAETISPEDVHAQIAFFSERDGFAKETDRIVYSDQFHVRVTGLPASAEVVVRMRTYSPAAKGRGYTSSATFAADAGGVVDTGTAAPIRGDYSGVDPDGLVWSAKGAALAEGLGPDRAAAFFDVTMGGIEVGKRDLGRDVTAPGVKIEKVTANGLVGQLYLPAGAQDKVPIVAFGGSEGGISGGSFVGARLSSFGHPVLALAYFGAAGVPSELELVPLEYFEKAFAYLDGRPEMRKGKVVVSGGSRGGELALLLGATFPNVAGVIAVTPSSHVWAGLSITEEKSAWSFSGTPLPFVPSSPNASPSTAKMPDGTSAWVLTPMFDRDMADATPAALDAARIHVEDTKGPILMLGGSEDALWPACDFMGRAMSKLGESGHAAAHGDESVCFPGAGHNVSGVGLPAGDSMWADFGAGNYYALGGTAAANGRAARQAHIKEKAFLERVAK